MEAFNIIELVTQQKQQDNPYLEFLHVPSLSLGLYVLPTGGTDTQEPHTEDEVYYVISGRGSIRVGTETRQVEAGSIVFVAANVEHRFFSITEDLAVLVFFAPAEYTNKES